MGRFLLKRLGLALDHALPPERDRLLRRAGAAGQRRPRRSSARSPTRRRSTRSTSELGTDQPLLDAVLGLDHEPPPRRPRHSSRSACPSSELIGTALVNSVKLAAPRLRARRAARRPRRRRSRRSRRDRLDRPRHHHRRPLAHGRARVRHGHRPHPRLRALARRAAGERDRARRARSFLTQIEYLLLPALALVLLLFGYIARMARAGTIEALDADYTRTAVLKGLPRRTVLRRHVLRNSLLPTIAVVATQIGYLIGGLVVDRDALQLPRHRAADLHRGDSRRTARPGGGRPHRRRRLPGRDAHRRPRSTRSSTRASATRAPNDESIEDPAAPIIRSRPGTRRTIARRERLRLLVRSQAFLFGRVILVGFWVVCADLRHADRAARPAGRRHPQQARPAPSGDHCFGTDRLGRDVFSRVIVGARDDPHHRAARDAARHGRRHRPRPRYGLLPRPRRRRDHAHRRRVPRGAA